MPGTEKAVVWRLRKGGDKRFREGHPWVFSNELAESPKGLEPGAPVELRDAGGRFLARGYGNPKSLITFRALTRDEAEADPWATAFLGKRLQAAAQLRKVLGLENVSHRLFFGEADGVPGLITDRYIVDGAQAGTQLFVVQAQTAGAEKLIPALLEALEQHVSAAAWERSAVLIKNNSGSRKLEGLPLHEAGLARSVHGVDVSALPILVASACGGPPMRFIIDAAGGQKTGFFLDQAANVALAAQFLNAGALASNRVRILDLCTYVGQWGAQLGAALKRPGKTVVVTAVDASERALTLAKRNIEAQGLACETLKADVLEGLGELPPDHFDVVVSDPPALIKSRKGLSAGKRAYLQLNAQALRLAKKGGFIISSSCSYHLDEESFLELLAKAARRNGKQIQWIARGGQAPDHPVLAEFPEGRYLKIWMGRVP